MCYITRARHALHFLRLRVSATASNLLGFRAPRNRTPHLCSRLRKMTNRGDKGCKVTKQERQGLESYKTGATRVGKLQNRSDKGWKVAKQERQGLESDCEKWVCTVVTSLLLFHQM